MQTMVVYCTFPDTQAATACARALLDARLIACANLLPGARSIYRWEGQVEEAQECLMFAKTTAALAEKTIDKIRALHPYTCPCIEAWPVTAGYAPFLQWVADETGA